MFKFKTCDPLVKLLATFNRIVPARAADSESVIILEATEKALLVGIANEGKTAVAHLTREDGYTFKSNVALGIPYYVFNSFVKRLPKTKSIVFKKSRNTLAYATDNNSFTGNLTTVTDVDYKAALMALSFAQDVQPDSYISLLTDDVNSVRRYLLFDTFGFSDEPPAVKLKLYKKRFVFIASDAFSGALYKAKQNYKNIPSSGLIIPGYVFSVLAAFETGGFVDGTSIPVAVSANEIIIRSKHLYCVLPKLEYTSPLDLTDFLDSCSDKKPTVTFAINSSMLTSMIRDVTTIAEVNRVAPVTITVTKRSLSLQTKTLYGKVKKEVKNDVSNVTFSKAGNSKYSFTVYSKVLVEFVTSFKNEPLLFEVYDSFIVQRTKESGVVYGYALKD